MKLVYDNYNFFLLLGIAQPSDRPIASCPLPQARMELGCQKFVWKLLVHDHGCFLPRGRKSHRCFHDAARQLIPSFASPESRFIVVKDLLNAGCRSYLFRPPLRCAKQIELEAIMTHSIAMAHIRAICLCRNMVRMWDTVRHLRARIYSMRGKRVLYHTHLSLAAQLLCNALLVHVEY